MNEKYTNIPGYEHKYSISTSGEVWSFCLSRNLLQRIRSGYKSVKLSKINYQVHRLVALTYIPNPYGYRCINHIDGVKNNNSVENLEWCNHKQNTRHAIKMGLRRNIKSTPEKLILRDKQQQEFIKIIKKIEPLKRSNCIAKYARDLHVPYSTAWYWWNNYKDKYKEYSSDYKEFI